LRLDDKARTGNGEYYLTSESPSFLEPRTADHYLGLAPQANHEFETGNV